MNKFKILNEANLILYAMHFYNNPSCQSIGEFEQDMNSVLYIKRWFKKYESTQEIKERIVLNHIITFYNVFGIEAATRILFLKIPADQHHILKTFLLFLNYISNDRNYSEWGIDIRSIPLDQKLVDILRKIN